MVGQEIVFLAENVEEEEEKKERKTMNNLVILSSQRSVNIIEKKTEFILEPGVAEVTETTTN